MRWSGPRRARPLTWTVFRVPTFASRNAPVAPLVSSVTVSPLMTPTSAAPPRLRVATVPPSYGRLLAVIPLTVSPSGVMLANVVGWVSV